MFRRFWPTKRVYGNHRHWCSFKATLTYIKWRRISRATKLLSRFFQIKKKTKNSQFFRLKKKNPSKSKLSAKNMHYVRGQCQWICVQNFKLLSSKMAEMWHETCLKQELFTSFRDFTVIFLILFLTDFDASKGIIGSFFAFLAKIWLKNMYRSSKSLFYLFYLVTWDDLDLYYGHNAQEMMLTDVSDTIHADSLALFALNIEFLLSDVTKPEKSKIIPFTWPVTSSVISRSNFWPCTGISRSALSNVVWNLEIGPVVWEISGGHCPPPPSRTCY